MFSAAPADLDATLAGAHDLRALGVARPLRVNDSLAANDLADCFRFSLGTQRNVSLKLDLLTADLDVELLDAGGGLIASSSRSGTSKELISARLGKGTYVVRIIGDGAASGYRLNIADATEQTFFALAAQVSAIAPSGDLFFKVPDALGEVTDKAYAGWIAIDSYSWGLTVPTTTGSSALASPVFSPISLNKPLDKSSVKLFSLAAQRKSEKTCILAVYDGTHAVERLRITLGAVQFTGFNSTQQKGAVAQESVKFIFQTISVKYVPVNSAGVPQPAIVAGWDVKSNKAV